MCITMRVELVVKRNQLRVAARTYHGGTYAATGAESRRLTCAAALEDESGASGANGTAVACFWHAGSRGCRWQHAALVHVVADAR